jgi:hypothetical protein
VVPVLFALVLGFATILLILVVSATIAVPGICNHWCGCQPEGQQDYQG